MSSDSPRLQLELPPVPGGQAFLDQLSQLLHLTRIAKDDALRVPARRPVGSTPEIELRISERASPRLTLVQNASEPIAFEFDFETRAPTVSRAGERLPIARDLLAEVLDLDAVRDGISGSIQGIDHLGLNLPASQNDAPSWITNLRAVATYCSVLPFDAEAEIAFVLPTTEAERRWRGELEAPDAVRKPKLELVRDGFLKQPMIGFAVDTTLSLDELIARFPAPRSVARPGNEPFFRSLLLAHPWRSFLFSLDLNSRSTSQIEIARLLVDGGLHLPDEAPGTVHG